MGDEAQKLKIALERGNAFAEAGADCVFIPGAIDEATVFKTCLKVVNNCADYRYGIDEEKSIGVDIIHALYTVPR